MTFSTERDQDVRKGIQDPSTHEVLLEVPLILSRVKLGLRMRKYLPRNKD